MNNKKLRNIPNSKKVSDKDLKILKDIEKKVSWLSAWMIHNANNIRKSEDGLKVGGHQASSASIVSIMVALYFKVLQSEDRVAVKPHAAPVFHSIQYLLGNQTKEKLDNFRGFGGAQSYPSRTKDTDDVDYSTGSVGLGGAITIFGSLMQDYLYKHNFINNKIFNVLKLVRPDVIYTNHPGDNNIDHRITFESTYTACRPNNHFKIKEFLTYEVPSSTDWASPSSTPFLPKKFVDITKFSRMKKKLLNCYKKELRTYPHPRSLKNIDALEIYRGGICGSQKAEAFDIIKIID